MLKLETYIFNRLVYRLVLLYFLYLGPIFPFRSNSLPVYLVLIVFALLLKYRYTRVNDEAVIVLLAIAIVDYRRRHSACGVRSSRYYSSRSSRSRYYRCRLYKYKRLL